MCRAKCGAEDLDTGIIYQLDPMFFSGIQIKPYTIKLLKEGNRHIQSQSNKPYIWKRRQNWYFVIQKLFVQSWINVFRRKKQPWVSEWIKTGSWGDLKQGWIRIILKTYIRSDKAVYRNRRANIDNVCARSPVVILYPLYLKRISFLFIQQLF